jgi:hypothetical protein
MHLRAPLAFVIALAALIGCVERHYRFLFHKDQVSQVQLLRDQAALRKKSGVLEVYSTANHDGSATLEIEVKDGKDIEIQQLLSSMGYTREQH